MHDWGGYGMHDWGMSMSLLAGPFIGLLALLALWGLFWKGLALWHAARRGEPWWFVAMLIINTFGILEIIYLFAIAKLKWNELFSTHAHHAHTHTEHTHDHSHHDHHHH